MLSRSSSFGHAVASQARSFAPRLFTLLTIAVIATGLLAACGGAYGLKEAYAPRMAESDSYGDEVAYGGVSGDADAMSSEPGEPSPEPVQAGDTGENEGRWESEDARLAPSPPPQGADRRVAKAAPARGPMGRPGQPEPGRPIDATKPAESTSPGGAPVTATDVPPTDPPPETAPAPDGQQTLAGPLLIYNATVHMAVFEVASAVDKTMTMAKERGGYLVRRDDRVIVIRVPAASYRQALEAIGKLGDVLHRQETVEDVTDQFFDLQVRVRNARVVRERLEQLLSQAKTVEEALMVERELGRVTTEIERLEGKLKLFRELVAFSTITVEFRPRAVEQVGRGVRLPFGWLDSLGLPNLLSL